jgi:uncharacterized Fe-S center protein
MKFIKKLFNIEDETVAKANKIAAVKTLKGEKSNASSVIMEHAKKGVEKEYNETVEPLFRKGTL